MSDLRFRTFRMRVYARLLPKDASAQDRGRLAVLADRLDEDGVGAVLAEQTLTPQARRALEILKAARELAERVNVLDRTVPVLPHAEIAQCYQQLRVLGNEIADLEAAGLLG